MRRITKLFKDICIVFGVYGFVYSLCIRRCFTDSSEFANNCLKNGISIKW